MGIYENNKGRGVQQNPTSRFHSRKLEVDFSDYGWVESDDLPKTTTEFLNDHAKTVINSNSSPDIGFDFSINPYRGCEHGCAYCYARPTHEYLDYSAGLDFESKILVKKQAAVLLRQQLMKPSWKPTTLFMSGVTDCYQPGEKIFKITRSVLEVLNEFKNPVALITKNRLLLRDLDVFREMASENRVRICISITTLNADLAKKLEPRTSIPQARLHAVEALAQAGIPVTVNMAPVIPGLTDHEIPALLKAVAEAGAWNASYTPVRLPYSVKEHFEEWLGLHFPEKKDKVLNAIRDIRGGQLNDPSFGSRMQGVGKRAVLLANTFAVFKKKFGLTREIVPLNKDLFCRPTDQMSLF